MTSSHSKASFSKLPSLQHLGIVQPDAAASASGAAASAIPPRSSTPALVRSGSAATLRALQSSDASGSTFCDTIIGSGEVAAIDAGNRFFWEENSLAEYASGESGMAGTAGCRTAALAPWLATGCISSRWVHTQCSKYEKAVVINKATHRFFSRMVQRDYLTHFWNAFGGSMLAEAAARADEAPYTLNTDAAHFKRWREGTTGVPLVDAAMRELATTGVVSERARWIAASYLVHDLMIDWRLGAEHYEASLLDYDEGTNWARWAMMASIAPRLADKRRQGDAGNVDAVSKNARALGFGWADVTAEGYEHDPLGTYIKTWVAELSEVQGIRVFEPWTIPNPNPKLVVKAKMEQERRLRRTAKDLKTKRRKEKEAGEYSDRQRKRLDAQEREAHATANNTTAATAEATTTAEATITAAGTNRIPDNTAGNGGSNAAAAIPATTTTTTTTKAARLKSGKAITGEDLQTAAATLLATKAHNRRDEVQCFLKARYEQLYHPTRAHLHDDDCKCGCLQYANYLRRVVEGGWDGAWGLHDDANSACNRSSYPRPIRTDLIAKPIRRDWSRNRSHDMHIQMMEKRMIPKSESYQKYTNNFSRAKASRALKAARGWDGAAAAASAAEGDQTDDC